MLKNEALNKSMVVSKDKHNTKLARLNYKVLESISLKDTDNNDFSKTGSEQSGLSLVEINLETGEFFYAETLAEHEANLVTAGLAGWINGGH